MSKPNINPSLYKLESEYMSSRNRAGNITPITLTQVEKEFNAFKAIDMSDAEQQSALYELFPDYLIETCDADDWQLFLAMGRYDSSSHTFLSGCFENQDWELKLISYKWRYKDGIKWKTRAGTSPNGSLFIRIFSDDRTVYVVEGHRDSLTAVLLGLDFIMIPYAGFKLKNAALLRQEVSDRKVVFISEDQAAFNCMHSLSLAIEDIADEIVLIQLMTEEKCDLTDFALKKNSVEEVIYGLKNKESH